MDKLPDIFRNPLGSAKGIFYLKEFIFSFLLLLSLKSTSQPKLEITEAKKDFGSVKRGELIKNTFEIRNTGNQPLLLTEAEVSCSCTTVDFPKQPILPGEKVTVLINFNTATVYGRQDRIVYLYSNDPKGRHKLRYKGNVLTK